jgi:hypothetical protein
MYNELDFQYYLKILNYLFFSFFVIYVFFNAHAERKRIHTGNKLCYISEPLRRPSNQRRQTFLRFFFA